MNTWWLFHPTVMPVPHKQTILLHFILEYDDTDSLVSPLLLLSPSGRYGLYSAVSTVSPDCLTPHLAAITTVMLLALKSNEGITV